MAKKLIVGVLGLGIVVAGIAAFSAFTAQIVNLEARVEKEIELEVVTCDIDDRIQIEDPNNLGQDPPVMINNPDLGKILPDTCVKGTGDYGVVLPQTAQDKIIELTLSKSFFKQDKWFDVQFDLLWECKQAPHDLWDNDVKDAAGKYTSASPDTIPDCRDNLPHTDADLDLCNGNAHHVGVDGTCNNDDDELDGNIRDHIALTIAGAVGVTDGDRCKNLGATRGSNSSFDDDKEIEFIAGGIVDKGAKKCFWTFKLNAPPCIQGYNRFTDPDPKATPVFCHTIDTGDPKVGNPQDLETFTDLGDDFKIQVWRHSLPPSN
jgi:hypothetical protein